MSKTSDRPDIEAYVARVVSEAPEARPQNPFGKWTTHRAQIAALTRSDARNPELEAEARGKLKAARLADVILRDRAALTPEQRAVLAGLLA